ncbi:MAG: V-type ATP synthase subunit D [Candidatus Bathyarchaeota archaeon]
MSREIVAGVHATRAEMLKLKRRVQIARRGHDLLVEKRDALLMHFFDAVGKFEKTRKRLEVVLIETYKKFIKARLSVGSDKIYELAYSMPERFEVDEKIRNIIGVSIPIFEVYVKDKPEKGWWYDVHETSAAVDDAIRGMEEAIKLMVELAEVETAVKRLAEVIIMTKRRVNALEKVIIPRLENTVRYIQMQLEERTREDFFRLKRIKKIHEVQKAVVV